MKKTKTFSLSDRINNFEILEEIVDEKSKNAKNETPINKPYIAVHFRNTDKQNDIASFIEQIKKIQSEKKINVLYVASDYFEAYDLMKKQLPDMKLIRKVIPVQGVKNIYYCTEDKYKQIYESLVDVYFILQSDYFVPSYNSGYSKGIIQMIKQGRSIFPDFKSQTKVV